MKYWPILIFLTLTLIHTDILRHKCSINFVNKEYEICLQPCLCLYKAVMQIIRKSKLLKTKVLDKLKP